MEDLLNASQLNDGPLHLNKTEINLAELVGDCVYQLGSKYEIITEGPSDLVVLADEGRIEQEISKFISNAIKYAPDSYQVLVTLKRLTDTVRVEVTDKGPGIAIEKMAYIFDRYYQIDSKGSKYSGLGLGLFICAEIIKRHDGKIGVDSQPGEGSTIWFSLPPELSYFPGNPH